MSALNIRDISDLNELEKCVSLGYVDNSRMMKFNITGRAVLASGVNSIFAGFNNLTPFLTTPATLYISSSSVSDTMSIEITYVNQDRDLAKKTVILNGQTAVSCGNDIYSIVILKNNSSIPLVGEVYVGTSSTPVSGVQTDANCYGTIDLTFGNTVSANSSLHGFFSVPRNYDAFVYNITATSGKNVDLGGAGFIREFGKTFRYTKPLSAFETSFSLFGFDRVKEKSDIRPLGLAQTGGIVTLEFDLLLIHKNLLDRYENGMD